MNLSNGPRNPRSPEIPKRGSVISHHEKVQGADERLQRKKELTRRRESDQRASGVVEIPGRIEVEDREEVVRLARNIERRERERGRPAQILSISDFEEGFAIETDDEKLAQRIADAIARTFHTSMERAYDDEGGRRILTLPVPHGREPAGHP